MPTIQILAEKVQASRGTDYYIANKALRDYIHSLTNEQFEEEAKRITNKTVVGQLWAAGLSAHHQRGMTERLLELLP